MLFYYVMLGLHVLGACFWVGGHLVLATTVLPRALREQRASIIVDFEAGYERVGMPALVLQIVTGAWLGYHLLGGSPLAWLATNGPARLVQVKLTLLAATVALAVHTKRHLIPRLRDDNLPELGKRIVAVTVLSVLFVLAGASLRLGGFPFFTP